MSTQRLMPYIQLLSSFVEERIGASDFEREYMDLFKNDSTNWSEQEFAVLDQLFADVDAFCADPDLRDPGDLDERELMEKSKVALEKLRVLVNR